MFECSRRRSPRPDRPARYRRAPPGTRVEHSSSSESLPSSQPSKSSSPGCRSRRNRPSPQAAATQVGQAGVGWSGVAIVAGFITRLTLLTDRDGARRRRSARPCRRLGKRRYVSLPSSQPSDGAVAATRRSEQHAPVSLVAVITGLDPSQADHTVTAARRNWCCSLVLVVAIIAGLITRIALGEVRAGTPSPQVATTHVVKQASV